MIALGAAIGSVVGLLLLIGLARQEQSIRVRWSGHALWLGLLSYPVVFALLDHRSAYLGPDEKLVDDATLGAVNAAFSTLVIFLCAGMLAAARTPGSGILDACSQGLRRPLVVPLGLFSAVLALLALTHGAVGAALGAGLVGLVLVVIVVAAEDLATVLTRVQFLGRFVVAGSLVVAVIVPGWAFVPYGYEGRALFGLGTRLIGLTPASNYLALFAVTMWFIELAAPRVTGATINWAWATAALVTCVWAQGRTAYLVLLLVTLFALRLPRAERALRALRGTALLGLTSLSLLVPIVLVTLPTDRALGLNDLVTGRVGAWDAAAAAVSDHWILGYGPDSFGGAFWQEYASSAGAELYANAHNQWLDVTAAYGLIGVLVLAGLVAALLRVGFQFRHVANDISLMSLVLLFSQFPLGTPMRSAGLSWNLLTVALVVSVLAGVRASALAQGHADQHKAASPAALHRSGSA